MKSRELLPYLRDYADRMEESLKVAEEKLRNQEANQGFKSMSREEFKELMTNVRTAARLIEHDNLKGDEWLDKLFDTLKQVYYLNDLNRTNNVDTESGN